MERELEIREHYLGGNDLEAYYFEFPERGLRAMAIEPSVGAERHRLWELVAHGIKDVPYTTRRLVGRSYPPGGFYFFGAFREHDADPLAVRAVAEVVAEMEPDWVRDVEDAHGLCDSPDVLAAWCEIPIEAVLALVGNWRTRL